jgi:hypothetical protein
MRLLDSTNSIKEGRDMRCFLAATILTLSAATANADITYEVNRTIGAGSVTGLITTDGTLGDLFADNISDWSLTLTAPDPNNAGSVISDTISKSSSDSVFIVAPLGNTPVTATTTQLIYDFTPSQDSTYMLFFGTTSPNLNWCLETINCNSDGVGSMEYISYIDTSGNKVLLSSVNHTGEIVFANTAVIPVPAAIWLFGSGLIGLAGFARRKK